MFAFAQNTTLTRDNTRSGDRLGRCTEPSVSSRWQTRDGVPPRAAKARRRHRAHPAPESETAVFRRFFEPHGRAFVGEDRKPVFASAPHVHAADRSNARRSLRPLQPPRHRYPNTITRDTLTNALHGRPGVRPPTERRVRRQSASARVERRTAAPPNGPPRTTEPSAPSSQRSQAALAAPRFR